MLPLLNQSNRRVPTTLRVRSIIHLYGPCYGPCLFNESFGVEKDRSGSSSCSQMLVYLGHLTLSTVTPSTTLKKPLVRSGLELQTSSRRKYQEHPDL